MVFQTDIIYSRFLITLLFLDSNFLLRFLRFAKFNVPFACTVLENYLIGFQIHPEWVQDFRAKEARMLELIECGIGSLLPMRDGHGRQLALCQVRKINPHIVKSIDLIQLAVALLDIMQTAEITQIVGLIFIVDATHITFRHLTMLSISELRYLVKSFLTAIPSRIQGLYILNIPWFAAKLTGLFLKMLDKEKTQNIHFIDDPMDIALHIDPSILPHTYGGKVDIQDAIQHTKKQLNDSIEQNCYKFDNFIKVDFKL
jgi:hypothetical protein